jgi:hypothetical protein
MPLPGPARAIGCLVCLAVITAVMQAVLLGAAAGAGALAAGTTVRCCRRKNDHLRRSAREPGVSDQSAPETV